MIADSVSTDRVAALDDGGFRIRSVEWEGADCVVVTASTDRGLVYGTFHLLRLMTNGCPIDDLDVTGFVKTTGSRGIHVHVPLRGDAGFDAIGALGHHLGALLARRHPDLLTVEFSKEDRGDRLFVDTLRNAPAQRPAVPPRRCS